MHIDIRPATIEDSASIAPLLLRAMEDIIYKFIGKEDYQAAIDFLLHFIKSPSNQYSYTNISTLTLDEKIIGVINVYLGDDLLKFRQPIKTYLLEQYNQHLTDELETEPGEIYIDSFAIDPLHQGKGYGKLLIKHIINTHPYKDSLPFGLLVDMENENALKLYQSLNFQPTGYKTLTNKKFLHLQIS